MEEFKKNQKLEVESGYRIAEIVWNNNFVFFQKWWFVKNFLSLNDITYVT